MYVPVVLEVTRSSPMFGLAGYTLRMPSWLIKIAGIAAVPLGAFLFVYGGYDDSPGAQLFGLIIVILGIVGAIWKRKKNS